MTTNLFDLKRKIALVTGASRGIGEEIAKLLAEQGAHVIVSSRKLEDCESVARGIKEAGGRVGGPDGAAARLGLKRTTMIAQMKRLGINPRTVIDPL